MDSTQYRPSALFLALGLATCVWGCAHQREVIHPPGSSASAKASLMAQAEKFKADMRAALAELEQKHAFERG